MCYNDHKGIICLFKCFDSHKVHSIVSLVYLGSETVSPNSDLADTQGTANWHIYLIVSYVCLFQALKPVKFGSVVNNMESPTIEDGSPQEIPQELPRLEDEELEENNSSRSLGIVKYTPDELMTSQTSPLCNDVDISVKEKVTEEIRKGGGKRGGMRLKRKKQTQNNRPFAPTVSWPTVDFYTPHKGML